MFDVIIIGGGPGGYKTAELCGREGLKVALVENDMLGGTCLNQGCIPFKTYLHNSRICYEAKKACDSGFIMASEIKANQENLLEYKDKVVRGLAQSLDAMLKHFGVEIITGNAKIVSNTGNSFVVSVGEEQIESRYLVVATGSEEKKLPIPSEVSYNVIYSSDMLKLDNIPDNIVVIGGGSIGLEAASYYSDLGCEVSVYEKLGHIGGRIDSEISLALERVLTNRNISFYTNTNLKAFSGDEIVFDKNGEEIRKHPQNVLVSIGRAPKIDKKSMESIGVQYSDRGITIDSSCRTNIANVYACGDVTGEMMLAHTAYRQAKVITDQICGKKNEIDYQVIPRIIYTNPEVLTIGVTEDELNGVNYTAKSIPMTYSGKYYAENGKDGAKAKLIVDEIGRVVGFHMLGNGASEISLAAELMIAKKVQIDELKDFVFAHPTYGEIIGELAGMF